MESTTGSKKKKRGRIGVNLEERRQRRRTALINAGFELFGTRGYRSCSVKMVCRHASLTERYFYESFANREALLIEVFDVLISEMSNRLLAILESDHYGQGSEKLLSKFVQTFFHFFREDKRRGRLVLFEILGVSAEMDRHYQRAVRDLSALVEHPSLAIFPKSTRSREARRIISLGLVGALLQIAVQWVMDDFKTSARTISNNTLQIFLAVSDRYQPSP